MITEVVCFFIGVMKWHDQKQLEKKRIYFISKVTVNHLGKSGHELKSGRNYYKGNG